MPDFRPEDAFFDGDASASPDRKNSLVPSATGIRRAAMDRLARREYARCELEQKLHRRFPDATAAIGLVLDELEHAGLLNTPRFIEAFTRSRINRGYGPLRIAAELRQRGVGKSRTDDDDHRPGFPGACPGVADPSASAADPQDAEVADNFRADPPAAATVDWLAQAREARCRRFGEALPADQKARNRQMAFLQRRGFHGDICRKACLPVRDED